MKKILSLIPKAYAFLPYTLSLILATLLLSCIDDKILPDDPNNGGGNTTPEEGALYFSIGTRGGFADSHEPALSEYEEEIIVNPDNFNVMLFTEGGLFLQEWQNQELTEFDDANVDGFESRKKYYVKIPTQDMDNSVIDYIRKNNFKIAVFANWAEYPKFTTTTETDVNGIDKNYIFYATHCKADPSYLASADSNPDQASDAETLYFITGQGFKMGMFQDWIAIRFQNDDEAETAIRNTYDVNNAVFHSTTKPVLTNESGGRVTFTDMKDYDYYNVWQIWNFGGETNKWRSDYYQSGNSKNRDDWAIINNDLYRIAFPSSWNDNNENSKYISAEPEIRGLKIVSNNRIKAVKDGNNAAGIQLPNSNRNPSLPTFNESEGAFLSYKLPADGVMYIRCRGTSNNSQLVVRRGTQTDTKAVLARTPGMNLTSLKFTHDKIDENGNSVELIRITGEPEDLVIYATGGDVIIYEIDYLKSGMIQSVDRQMVNPANTPEGGISMYGIQDFNKVPENVWPEGTTFNLSRNQSTHTGEAASSYKYRTVSMLRSVAKVEVYVPTDIFPEPSHMFIRTLNRFSRSAPMDVFTPTDIIWDGYNSSSGIQASVKDAKNHFHNYNQAKGVDQEVKDIQSKGFTFEKGNQDVGAYKNKLAWLFGIWNSEFGWNWANQNITIKETSPYPRIFNTRINRSDYAHMIDGGKVNRDGGEYYYYYAYLPEKNVTDPNSNGKLSDSPKVIRIEMRFGDRNTDTNLDDNASYRIYFTTDGAGGSVENRDQYDNTWESGNNNEANVRSIYPVIRNHLYRFKITGLQMNNLQVEFDVKGPENRDVNYWFD